jgi:hypothetical protein
MVVSQHYGKIYRRVFEGEWAKLDGRTRDIIAMDVDKDTREARRFTALINSITERLYNDPEYFFNDPFTFKVPYRIEEVEPRKRARK